MIGVILCSNTALITCPVILYFSGMFSSSFTSVSQAPSNFSNRSVAHALKARRPLISPAKFSFSKQQRSSTPTKFQGKFNHRMKTKNNKINLSYGQVYIH